MYFVLLATEKARYRSYKRSIDLHFIGALDNSVIVLDIKSK